MSGQDNAPAAIPQRPVTNDPKAWQAYWEAHGQPWRTEPEIDKKRQTYLAKRRGIVPDIAKGLYPFRDIKLSRADIEWVLATHDSGRGPVDWDDESQRERRGLDVRGANLCQVDLSGLPFACLCGGLTWNEWLRATKEQQTTAGVKMNNAVVGNARLEGAILYGAELQGIALYGTQLEGAKLGRAQLDEADLGYANFHATDLREAKLQRVLLFMANLEGADLREADFREADLRQTNLKRADLAGANLEGVKIGDVILAGKAGIGPWLADVQWGGANLAAVDWSQIATLGEEYQAQQKNAADGTTKNAVSQLYEYKTAVRANRQLAVALQDQGLNEEAARFAYRSQVWKQRLLFLQLLQHIADARILRWLLRVWRPSQDYWSLLPAAAMMVVFALALSALLLIDPKLSVLFGPSWLVEVAFSVFVCFSLELLVMYQPSARLLLLFLLLSALDLVLLYLAFLLLVTLLIDLKWRLSLFFTLLAVLMVVKLFWVFHSEPLASRWGIQTSFSASVKNL